MSDKEKRLRVKELLNLGVITLETYQSYITGVEAGDSDTKEFTKHDKGKTEFTLIDANWEEEIAKVLTEGARKYSAWNWQACKDPKRYVDACLRHLNAYRRGQWSDPDSGSPHIVHAAVNLMFLYWFGILETGTDAPAAK